MAEVMSMIPDESPAAELNADEQESLQIGEEMEAQQEQRLAGKYKNAEELEAAYLELQKKLGEQPSEEQEAPEEEEPESVGVLDQLWEQSKGEKFDQATLDQLSKTDPTELAKAYLDYRNQAEQGRGPQMTAEDAATLRNAVGGDEKYNEMLGWASKNMSEQEISLYDSVMDKGDPAAAYWAVQALSARYQDANGLTPDLVTGKGTPSAKGFRSQAELVAAMADPRYDNDPAYREDVMRKLSKSNVQF